MKHAGMLFVLFLAACGDDSAAQPDAFVPPIDAVPDSPPGPTCTAPSKMCGNSCLDVSQDEENCGDCGIECNGGEACNSTCACAPEFIPATITPGMFDMFQGAGGATIAIGPTFDAAGIHPILVGYDGTVQLNTDIDLSMADVGTLPFVAAGYRVDLGAGTFDAAFVATSGILRFTSACGSDVEGTLTNATFRGVNGGLMDPMVDPNGCSFPGITLAFHISTAPCP